MAQITVINDPRIEQTPIVHNLAAPGPDESDTASTDNYTEIQQTKVFGILCPLIAINGIAMDFTDIHEFELDAVGNVPMCKFLLNDRNGLVKQYSNPGNDNELRVQILPRTDGAYKKIDLTFLITDITVEGGMLRGRGTYKLPAFTESKWKALGKLTTYDMFKYISDETGLGFASNVEATEDARYMQLQFESYKDLIDKEIEKSGSDESKVFDWWIDLWNNLVLCDIYDRINSEDTEDDMKIWTCTNVNDGSINTEPEMMEISALFTNHPVNDNGEMSVLDYDVENTPTSPQTGNNIALSVYEEIKHDCIDHIIMDGDIQKNDFIKFEYAGEVYGEYNYLLAKQCRDVFLRKINSETIVLHLPSPQLSIMRGDQLRFVWYDNDTKQKFTRDELEEVGAVPGYEEQAKECGWLKDWIMETGDEFPMMINLQYSGQYTCKGQYIMYDQATQLWDCWLYLVRPASKRPKQLLIDEQENKQSE